MYDPPALNNFLRQRHLNIFHFAKSGKVLFETLIPFSRVYGNVAQEPMCKEVFLTVTPSPDYRPQVRPGPCDYSAFVCENTQQFCLISCNQNENPH